MAKPRVLFVGAHNSVRSQMAEGFLRFVAGDRYEALSAGIQPMDLDALAIEVMREISIDISGQHSKPVEECLSGPLSALVTLCDGAREFCLKNSPACKNLHWRFQDPVTITGSRRDRLAMLRLLRDEIAVRIEQEFGIVSLPSNREQRADSSPTPA